MKRITIILSLIAMMLVSGISFADDVNILLRNSKDNILDTEAKKTQVLFLIDLLAGGEESCTYKCYALDENGDKTDDLYDGAGTCPAESGGGGGGGGTACAAGCYDASTATTDINGDPGGFHFNVDPLAYADTNAIRFKGCFCPGGSEGSTESGGYFKEETCTTPGVTDVRPIIAKIMQERPDIKYGLMALQPDKTTKIVFSVDSRELGSVSEAGTIMELIDATDDGIEHLYDASVLSLMQPGSTGAIFPTVSGMVAVNDYLSGADSPLTNSCENLQLIIITNGGWQDDDPAPGGVDDDDYLLGLTNSFATSTVKSLAGCEDARVRTSVLGINVSEIDNTNLPLFYDGDTSVASRMADADHGNGIYKNVTSSNADLAEKNKEIGTGIYEAILDVVDFNREAATALVTPVAPVSITRGYNLDILYASSFEAKDGVNWPGNITRGDGSIPASNFVKSDFSFPPERTIMTVCGTTLCPLAVENGVITAADIAWLTSGAGGDVTDLLGDIVHFRPLPIHYGDLDDNSAIDDTELYVVVGTNRGLLHIFNKSGVEQWAFLPPQLKSMISALREGNTAPAYSMVNHFYGVDGAPSVFIYDNDKNGKIKSGESDKVILYFGLRRGGAGYFALDITTPGTPAADDLLWQIGGSALDYGTKPEADIVNGDQEREDSEIVPLVAGSGGGCPVFAGNAQACAIVNGIVGAIQVTDYYTSVTGEKFNHWPNIGPGGSAVYDFGHLYFAGMCGQCDQGGDANPICVEHCSGHDGEPVFTVQNQCIPDITNALDNDDNPVTSWSFDAHVSAMSPYGHSLAQKCEVDATLSDAVKAAAPDFSGASGVGDFGSLVATDGSGGTVVGFDITGLPENITIKSAQITFAHNGKGDVNPIGLYDTDKIYVYASAKGFIGNTAFPDGAQDYLSLHSTDDCRDENYFDTGVSGDGNRAARIQKPESGSYALGQRTTDGVLFAALATEEDREAKLNELFTNCQSNASSPCFIDTYKNNRWVQFKVNAGQPTANRVAWARAIAGSQATNWNEPGYWSYMPHLNLTWCYNGISGPEGCDYIEPSGPILNISIIGTGEVEVIKDTVSAETCTTPTSPCEYTQYIEDDEVTLTAVETAGFTFNSWNGCEAVNNGILSGSNDEICTITMDESKAVTANFDATPYNLKVTPADSVVAGITAAWGVYPADDVTVGDGAAIPNGTAVTLTAEVPSGKQFASWTDVDTCNTENPCEFTMPANNVTGTANYIDAAAYSLTVNAGANGTVTVGTDDCSNSTCVYSSASEQAYSLTIAPAENYQVDSITGCVEAGCSITINATNPNLTVDASFKLKQYTVIASVSGIGGTITPTSTTVDHNASATFTVTPTDSSYIITSVDGTGCTVSGINGNYVTDAITDNDCVVVATFEEVVSACTVTKFDSTIPTHLGGLRAEYSGGYKAVGSGDSLGSSMSTVIDLYCKNGVSPLYCSTSIPAGCIVDGSGGGDPETFNLTLTTDGAGTITANPSGTCGAGCYAEDTSVTITATAGPSNKITSWTDCSGSGVGSSSGSCSITMSAAKSVTVTFEADSSGAGNCDTSKTEKCSAHDSASRVSCTSSTSWGTTTFTCKDAKNETACTYNDAMFFPTDNEVTLYKNSVNSLWYKTKSVCVSNL